MKQNIKNKRMSIAIVFIVLVVYNIFVFTIPFAGGASFWTGYCFSMIALMLTAAMSFYALGREGLKSKFYGVPLISVVLSYLIIQLIIGLLEMALPVIPFQYGIALNSILLGACLIGLATVEAGKGEIERIDEKMKEKIFYIKSLQVDVEGLADRTSDETIKKMLKALAETIRYSDPMSSPQLAAIENKIEAKVSILTETFENTDSDAIKTLCNELQQLFAERNRKCKTVK